MSGLVGNSRIRNDAHQVVYDRSGTEQIPASLVEAATRIQNERVTQPFERSRTTPVKTLFEFYELFKKVLEFATEIDGTNYPIRYTLEYPPSPSELPCFTVKLVSRRALNLKGTKEMSPRFMQESPDPDYPGEKLQEFLVRRYNVIEITTWAKTNKVAQELVEWLEDVYWQYLWALQWGGTAHPVEWLDRGSDKYMEVREQPMYGAPTTFGVITAKITRKRVTTIRKMAYSLGLLINE